MVSFCIIAFRSRIVELKQRDYFLLFALAVVAILNDLCYFYAFTLTSVANAAIAHQSVSLFLIVLAPFLLKEHTRKEEWVALIFSFAGIVILYSNQLGAAVNGRELIGITLGIASGGFYALLIVLYRILSNKERGISINVVNFWRYLMSTILLLPFIALIPNLMWETSDISTLVGFGLVFAVIASGIHTYGVSKTRSLHVSIIGKSEPVFAIIYAFLFLHESPTVEAIVGGSFIIGSSLWLTARKEK